jgi:hypothetical protein
MSANNNPPVPRTPLEDLLRPLTVAQPEQANQHLLTELHYDFSRDYSLPQLVGAFFKLPATDSPDSSGYYPVITSVKHLTDDIIEVRRTNVYRRNSTSVKFDKDSPNEEVITIDRSKVNRKPTDVVLESVSNIGFKN